MSDEKFILALFPSSYFFLDFFAHVTDTVLQAAKQNPFIVKMFVMIGILFVLNAIFGRYMVLPGYMESLESGLSSAGSIPEDIDKWKVARYLLWAYSFKLGIYFVVVGALLRKAVSRRVLAAFFIGGLLYIGFAYMPISGPSLLFGIGGGIMTVAIILLIMHLSGSRTQNDVISPTGMDFRIAGYFFFAMATYNLCPLLGVKCFALSPKKMILYNLQADAESFAAHILIELSAGWCLILASYLHDKRESRAGARN